MQNGTPGVQCLDTEGHASKNLVNWTPMHDQEKRRAEIKEQFAVLGGESESND